MLFSFTASLQEISGVLKNTRSLKEKISFLETFPKIEEEAFPLLQFIEGEEEKFLLYAVIAAGQKEAVFPEKAMKFASREKMQLLFSELRALESFYKAEGGIVGYQTHIQKLLSKEPQEKKMGLYSPPFYTFTEKEKQEAIAAAIEHYPFFGEVYPIGGAGDRLNLTKKEDGEPLPAALLPFCGKTLLQGLIEDVEAKEELCFRLLGKKVITPIALMTSQEKNNHAIITNVLEKHNYFDRPQNSFFLFEQPLVPVFSKDGRWLLKEPFILHKKPGGHGAVWKLMDEKGVFDWFRSKGRQYLLMRQINNPLSGIDDTLLLFLGAGIRGKYEWGFCSCERYVGSSEGMNVLATDGKQAAITNIEYTEFSKEGIEDAPKEEGSPYSSFPANTNILFAEMATLQKESKEDAFPGETLNMKSFFSCWDGKKVLGGRLETTMQNIADNYLEPWQEKSSLKRTFCTCNPREKTISAVKKAFIKGEPLRDTPWEGLYALMKQREELLQKCAIAAPSLPTLERFLQNGPKWLFHYHPFLGPLFSHISQKMRGGALGEMSFLQIELYDLYWKNVKAEGAILIKGPISSSCILENVHLQGPTISSFGEEPYFYLPKQALSIALAPHSLFVAKGITLPKGFSIFVEEGMKVEAMDEKGQIKLYKTPLQTPPRWHLKELEYLEWE